MIDACIDTSLPLYSSGLVGSWGEGLLKRNDCPASGEWCMFRYHSSLLTDLHTSLWLSSKDFLLKAPWFSSSSAYNKGQCGQLGYIQDSRERRVITATINNQGEGAFVTIRTVFSRLALIIVKLDKKTKNMLDIYATTRGILVYDIHAQPAHYGCFAFLVSVIKFT